MCVKLVSRDLNPSSCPPHLTSIYAYGMIIALRMCGDCLIRLFMKKKKIEEP